MFFSDPYSFCHIGRDKRLAIFNKMFDLIKDPWIANSSTTDHDPVNTIAVFIFQRFLRRIDVAVTENGNLDARIFFILPIRSSPLSLCTTAAGAAMDSERLNARILQTFGYFYDIDSLIIPAQSGLNCDG